MPYEAIALKPVTFSLVVWMNLKVAHKRVIYQSAPVVGAVGGPMTRIHLIYYLCVASILKEKWDLLKSVEITTV